MPKLISTVFAVNGDLAYPAASSTDGTVNLNAGYTPQYEINLASGDPTAKAVERTYMNGLFNWLFENQAFDQAHGIAPWFSDFSGGYPLNALVADNTSGTWQIYRSLVDGNTAITTLATAWEAQLTQGELLNRIPFALGGAKGSASGVIANGTSLNSWTYSQGMWVVQTDAIAASLTSAPSSRAGILIARNTTTNYNPSGTSDGGNIVQTYFDVDGKQYERAFSVASGATAAAWTAWRTVAFLDSPAFTGKPTAPTAAAGTNTTQIASTAFVTAAVATAAASLSLGRLINVNSFGNPGTYTFTKNALTKTILVEVQGAGGAGGSSNAANTSANGLGGGGGGGGYSRSIINSPADSYTVVVGAPGAPTSSGTAGNGGGNSSFGTSIVAYGGGGGANNFNATYQSGVSQQRSATPGSAAGGTIANAPGGYGMAALWTSVGNCLSGAGGSSFFSGVTPPVGGGAGAGVNGGFGAGGSGANSNSTTSILLGGYGGNGLVIVYEFG